MRKTAFLLIVSLLIMCAREPVLAQTQAVPESRPQIMLTFAPLVKQVAPAVVNIYSQRKVEQRLSPLFADPIFSQFFGGGVPGLMRERVENSLGSGVIVRGDGLIVTSNHVIAGADQIRVVLADHREYDATIIMTDEHSDLALLRVDTKGAHLPYLELRDSDTAEVGDLVLAIGNPFAVGQTVTSGIISALTHGAVGNSDLGVFIQTDAAINPGNSGGALVTMDGKLVGINSAIYSKSGGNLGIGFAVPSNMVRVLISAVEQGRTSISRPWTGIDGQDVTPELAASMNLAQPYGVLVKKVQADSPAAKAGLTVGDVIVAVDGRTVEDTNAFRYRIDTLSVGSKISMSAVRKGQKFEAEATLAAPPEIPPRDKTEVTGHNPFAGAVIENLSPAVIEETGIRGVEHGVVVVAVKGQTAAANIGLRPGDILLSINGAKLASVSDVMDAVEEDRGRWRISVQRGEEVITVMVGG